MGRIESMSSDERELLQAWGEGDEQAGAALFRRYYPAIERFFRNKVPEPAQQDLIQETFLACVDGRQRLRATNSLRSYLFSVAYKKLCSYYRRRHRQPAAFESSEVSVKELEPGPSSVVARRQEHRLLIDALRSIPIDHQVILELCYWEGHTAAELGEILGVPLGTAKTRIRRARQLLSERVEQLGAQPASGGDPSADIERWAQQIRESMDERRPGS